MTIKKTSILEFYKLELVEIDDNEKDLFTVNLNEYSDGNIELVKDYHLVFQYIKNEVENEREIIIRNKKHKIWIDTLGKELNYICLFSSRENQNGALINKVNFNIVLAQDEKLNVELASLSHFVIDKENSILALEKFDGSTSKTSLVEYCNSFLKNTNLHLTLYPIPRDDLEQILNDVKEILTFKAKYRDIKEVFPEFLENHIFSKSRDIKLTQENQNYQTKIDISFGKGTEINSNDTIISKLKNKLFPENNPKINIEENYIIDGRIDVKTNYGSEETIKLQENLFIEKLQINIEDDISDREGFSSHVYKKIIEKVETLIKKRNK